MAISMYQISVPVFIHILTNLDNVLRKGEAFAREKNIDESVLVNSRLAVDMYPLIRQIQIASDIAKGAGARLAGLENPSFKDNEQTFAELYARIHKTVEFLSSIKPEQVDGSEGKTIFLKTRSRELNFTGIDYVLYFVYPNVGFHVTTAYDILRHHGVQLAKIDYLGNVPQIQQ